MALCFGCDEEIRGVKTCVEVDEGPAMLLCESCSRYEPRCAPHQPSAYTRDRFAKEAQR